ncbi:DnaJ domain-containing protein [Coemansia sp. RSA 1933]|nr:DnaJ domain-containing protein [Coemansia sp. RSA 1933]
MADAAKEVERLLQNDTTQLLRTQEVDRVLAESPLEPFAILGVAPTCSTDDVRAAYRSKSRLIHPDKTTHLRAREAFEKLKRAESELMDDGKRKSIVALMDEARREVAAQWQQNGDKDGQAFEVAAKAKYRAIVVDIEWRRRQKVKQELAAEGAIKAKAEDDARERRRKRDAEKAWDAGREERVGSWRDFVASGSIKKKKKKTKKPPKSKP